MHAIALAIQHAFAIFDTQPNDIYDFFALILCDTWL